MKEVSRLGKQRYIIVSMSCHSKKIRQSVFLGYIKFWLNVFFV